ncbi:MAG: amidohydrolase family protein [Lewinellaceae bacterium]|nr:amidohydrolase family protein [Lewinellaceae bacterium]
MINRRTIVCFTRLLLWTPVIFSGCSSPTPFQELLQTQGHRYDLLICNGRVLDGQDSIPRLADVLIRHDSILFIGEVDTSFIEVEQRIDASDKFITPGFIDTHAHGDPLETPGFENFLAMGVTTICLGQDGDSPEYENIRPWMEKVDSVGPGVNIAMFAGHGTLRRLSGVEYKPEPAPAEMGRMKALLADAMDAGCFGMTTGLEYTPGTYAGDEELAALAKVVGENGGLIMSHVRNEDNDAIEASIKELLRQGRYCNVQVSHLKVVYGKGEERAEEIIALLDSARNNSAYSVTADIYPYTASYTGIGIVFPQWAKPPNDYEQVKRERRKELLEFLYKKVMARNGPEATLFGTEPYAGKTLAQVAAERGKPFEEVLLNIGPGGASGAYFVMDESLQGRLLEDPHVMICSDGSPTMHHPRGYGSFAKIIEQYVQQEQRFSLAEAVRKMTSLPARTLGLQGRGILKAGSYADLLVFDPRKVKARAGFSEPHRLAQGMDWVVVNGKIAFQGGQLKGRRGIVLKK